MKILIAGGGIGGLALALALAEEGIDFTVYEGTAEVRPLGVGINVLPHAVGELAALGVLPALEAASVKTRALEYRNRFGQLIQTQLRGRHAGHALPQLSIHRAKLHRALLDAVIARKGPEAVRLGFRIEGFRDEGHSVVALFRTTDRERVEVEGDALVGADGIHSAVRSQLHPGEPPPSWNGVMMWRGAVEWPTFDGGDTMVVAGDMKEKLLYYPILQGAAPGTMLTNWVLACEVAAPGSTPPRREDWVRPGRLEDILPYAGRFSIPGMDVAELFRRTLGFLEYPMCDRPPLASWGQGRVTLLGDAAHPMYPVGSNGAAQSIIDGRRLAHHLAGNSVEQGFAAYEAERLPVTSEIVLNNRLGGPERVVDIVSALAPNGFDRLEDVISPNELADVDKAYARIAGFALRAAQS